MDKSTLIETIATAIKSFSETPVLDARFFCEHYGNQPTPEQISDFVARRSRGEPVSKIIGTRGFWKRDFIVSHNVLDPRPDSETLIDTVLRCFPEKSEPYRILDIGTGSGCLILSLSDEYPEASCFAVDKSSSALSIARQNDTDNRVQFYEADFTTADFGNDLGQFDMIVSNPPYIPSADILELDTAVRTYDPLLALDGGVDGLSAYRALSSCLTRLLKPTGHIFFEIGQGQERDVIALMSRAGLECVMEVKDLGQITRCLVFVKSDL